MKQVKTEGQFIPHCDANNCNLGSFDYTCPACGAESSDFDVWWQRNKIYAGLSREFKCEKCASHVKVSWDDSECEYFVEALEG